MSCSFKTMIIYLVIAGGIISILGDVVIRFVLFLLGRWNVSRPWYSILLDPTWMTLDFVAGVITVSIFLPFIIRKVRSARENRRNWSVWWAWLGAIAGICNSIILATIHLTIMSSLGQYGFVSTLKLLGTYLPITAILMGLPVAIVGALAGMIASWILHRFIDKWDQVS